MANRPKVETPQPAEIELRGNRVAVDLSDLGQGRSLRQVLPDQPVGVLVGAALPSVVRRSDVELDPGRRHGGKLARFGGCGALRDRICAAVGMSRGRGLIAWA
jgi:hypothetical protein